MQYLICGKCGNLVELVREGGKEMRCCGERMERIDNVGSSVDREKHMPTITLGNGVVKVTLGEGHHPMSEEHYIGWIALATDKGVQRKAFTPSDVPEAEFPILKGESPREAIAFCNLHGIWRRSLEPEYSSDPC